MTQKSSIVTHRIAVGEKLIQAIRSYEGRQLRQVQETWELRNPELRDAWYVRIHGEEQGPVEYADINHALLEGYGPVEVLHADRVGEEGETIWTPVAYDPFWSKKHLPACLTAAVGIIVAILLSILAEALLPWPWEGYASKLIGLVALAWWLLPFLAPRPSAGKEENKGSPEPEKIETSIEPVNKADRLAA